MKRDIEILSPAGDMECLDSAIKFGANAIYLAGEEFGMRTAAKNFNVEDMKEAVAKAHAENKKIYVTCNTLPRADEIKRLPIYLEQLNEAKVDAMIITDLGVMKLAQKYAPNVDIHISTQAGIVNAVSANMFYELGATRVVLARELNFLEIREIRENIPKKLQIECFVHGAMCMSFSGRCLISSYLTGRDANRGDCAQPCRWRYSVMEENRQGEQFPLIEDNTGSYLFNSRDLCMIEHISDLVNAGVDSLKIEGRAKSAYYVATITNAYRAAIDAYLNGSDDSWFVDEVDKISHREYSKGFFFGNEPGQVISNGGYIRKWEVVGVVEDYSNGEIKISQRNKFYKNDIIEIMDNAKKPFTIQVNEMYDERHNPIENAPHATQTVYIPSSIPVSKGAYLRKEY